MHPRTTLLAKNGTLAQFITVSHEATYIQRVYHRLIPVVQDNLEG